MENTSGNRKFFVKSLDDQKLQYNLPKETTIEKLKELLSKETSLPLVKIRLIYNARNLINLQKLEEILLKDDEVVHLVARLKTEEPQQPQPQPQNNANPNNTQNNQNPIPGNIDLNNILSNFSNMFGGGGNTPNGMVVNVQNLTGNNPGNNNNSGNGAQNGLPPGIQNILSGLFRPNNNNNNNQAPNMNFSFNSQTSNPQSNNPNPNNFNSTPNPQTNTPNPHTNTLNSNPSPQNPNQSNQTPNIQPDEPLPSPQNMTQTPNRNNQPDQALPQQNMANVRIERIQLRTNQNIQVTPNENSNRDIPLNSGMLNQNNSQNRPDIPLSQNQRQQRRNINYMSNNPQNNHVQSVNNNEINLSFNSLNRNGQELFSLNTKAINDIKNMDLKNRRIPWRLPRRTNENSATMVGNYLESLHTSLYYFLPDLSKTSDILKNEQLLNSPEQRRMLTKHIQRTGKILEEYSKIFKNLEFLERLELQNQPMGFNLNQTNTSPNAPQNNVQNTQNQSPQTNLQNSERITPEEENEDSKLVKDREQIKNLMNIMERGVNLNTTNEQLTEMSGAPKEEIDLMNIVTMDMIITDTIGLIQGNSEILDKYKEKIKFRFQNMLLKHQNDKNKVIKELMVSMIELINDIFTKEAKECVYEGFSVEKVTMEVCEEYYQRFKDIFLKDYPEGGVKFSEEYTSLMKDFLGKIAYEVSEGLVDGIDDFEKNSKIQLKIYLGKRIGDNFPLTDDLFEMGIWCYWPSIYDSYKKHKNDVEKEEQINNNFKKLEDIKKLDQEIVPETELSENYKKGSPF